MNRRITRRNLLKFVGGSAAGVFLTPVPWKTLDDVAIWSQNWSWIPKPPRGEVKTRFSTCALCPAGCGVKARCVGDQPVSLSGITGHPAGRGALCPIGFCGHHQEFRPDRLLQPVRLVRHEDRIEVHPVSVDTAAETLGRLLSETKSGPGSVAILDERPGRTTSQIYRMFLAKLTSGAYIVPQCADGASFDVLRSMFVEPRGPFGFDVENTATILSFGAPILDGWGSPNRVLALSRRQSDREKRLKVVQIETSQSRTASLADLWIPVKPGTETAMALGLANVLIAEKLCDVDSARKKATDFETAAGATYVDLVRRFTPGNVSRITGAGSDRIVEVARRAAADGPTLAVGGGDPGGGPLGEPEELSIWGLNFLLGSIGRKGGVVERREVPGGIPESQMAQITQLPGVPDGSIRLLILDGSSSESALPWALIERKLAPKSGLVVSLSPTLSGHARHADLVIPAPAHFESFRDLPSPIDSPVAVFSVSAPFTSAPPGVVDPVDLIYRVAVAAGLTMSDDGKSRTLVDHLKDRANEIREAGRGRVFSYQDSRWIETTAIESGENLWNLIGEGACWVDAESEVRPLPRFNLLGRASNAFARLAAAGEGRLRSAGNQAVGYPLVLMPSGWHGAVAESLPSPLMTKLFQESGTRGSFNQAAVNPETGKGLRLEDGGKAILETAFGRITAEIRFDASIMPGIVSVAVGPAKRASGKRRSREEASVLNICRLDEDYTWRVTPATVREG